MKSERKYLDPYQMSREFLSSNLDEEIADELLKSAMTGLYKFIASDGDDSTYWDMLDKNPEQEQLLTTPQKELSGNSILSTLNSYIRENQRSVGIQLGLIEEEIEEKDEVARKNIAKKRRSSKQADSPFPNLYQLGDLEDVYTIPQSAKSIHISRPSILRHEVLEGILGRNPNVNVVQVPPSMDKTHLNAGARKMLKERGVEVRVGRYKNSEHYNEPLILEEHIDRQKFYKECLDSPSKAAFLSMLRKYEFSNVEIVDYLYGSKKPVPMTRAVDEFSLPYEFIQRKVATLMYSLGYTEKITDGQIALSASALERRLDRLKQADADARIFNEMRNQYKVGEVLPPKNLQPYRWPMWQKVANYIVENPDEFQRLQNQKPREFDAIASYFMISSLNDRVTLDEISNRHQLSRERIRQLKESVLQDWGLFDDD